MSDVKSEVEKLDGWTLEGEKISKKFKFTNYLDGIHFTEKIGIYAESVQHHPGISINYTTVTVSWTTFSKKELTEKDVSGAKACENLYRLFKQAEK
ncbi:4a-hydroxytetrahydrobiopterin dehydratase [Salinicoccus bachuensis]|uniref:4a-hydroxytetrahydrobiopterin dehydratase n=1 Tax=Salinicoccus bachuensis TaxID=3136731 RepID=A0ABZ3CIG5_9STAP